MTQQRTVLVTGGTGRLGKAVCAELVERGHRVRATDLKFEKDVATELLLGDLRDELFAYRALEGCDAVVHLGNHPNAFAGPSTQRLLAENTAMNANVVCAAQDLGVRDIVFASSIQVTLASTGPCPPPYAIPYLPFDGNAPTNPGKNSYALSKEFCERMLRLACDTNPELAATSLRFPMLVHKEFLARLRDRKRVPMQWLNFGELLAFLAASDASRLVALLLEKRRPGYRQYLPALSQEPLGMTLPQVIERFYAGIELRKPASEIGALIDISELERDLAWVPQERISFTLDE